MRQLWHRSNGSCSPYDSALLGSTFYALNLPEVFPVSKKKLTLSLLLWETFFFSLRKCHTSAAFVRNEWDSEGFIGSRTGVEPVYTVATACVSLRATSAPDTPPLPDCTGQESGLWVSSPKQVGASRPPHWLTDSCRIWEQGCQTSVKSSCFLRLKTQALLKD